MDNWEEKLEQVLTGMQGRSGGQVVGDIADLALAVPEARGLEWLRTHPQWAGRRAEITRLYYAYIVANETADVERLLAAPGGRGSLFKDLAGEQGRIAYDRVADLFDNLDFSGCRRFAMVGCGQLPVTALHVMERARVPHCDILDISPQAVASVNALKARFGWDALHPQLVDGKHFDFSGADIVFVANMVHDKADTVRRVLETTPAHVRLVIREPYSLGGLWAERAEPDLAGLVEVVSRGAVSRHLSRDVYVRRPG
jgi:hypothetical protein